MSDLAIGALATYRLTRLVTRDTITARHRKNIQFWATHNHHPMLYELVSCDKCVSVWAAGFLALLRLVAPKVYRPVAFGLACTGAVVLLDETKQWLEG